jgi:hypothetical protein
MFDTITGLPVHALVVHAVVVLLPLMSLVTFVVAFRAAWRSALPFVVVADFLVFLSTFVARQSGQALQGRLSRLTQQPVATEHGERGTLLIWFALALVVVAAIAWAIARSGGSMMPALALVAVVGLAATGWTVLTGDSGARAVWKDTIANTTSG